MEDIVQLWIFHFRIVTIVILFVLLASAFTVSTATSISLHHDEADQYEKTQHHLHFGR